MYEKGLGDGYKQKKEEIGIDSTMNALMSEKIQLMKEIDSLKTLKPDSMRLLRA